jgi:hypothetical protein
VKRTTPVTDEGLRRYDDLPAATAVLLAWTQAGPRPDWHRKAQEEVWASMPLLARALHRMATEQ